MENQKIAGLIVIATGKYHIFLVDLFSTADRYFLPDKEIDVYLFTDKEFRFGGVMPLRMTLHEFTVPHLPFPLPTLYRYKWIAKFAEGLTAKNLYYIDADMLFTGEVGTEIIPPEGWLVATRHPGFYTNCGWGDHETLPESLAYIKPALRHDYFAGGFQGGERRAYITAAQILDERIEIDFDTARDMGFTKNGGVIARWHDESHWNCWLKYYKDFIALSPEYCMVEEMELRRKWGIDKMTPRIVALKKDHKALRE